MEPSVKDKDKDKHKLSMNAHALHDLALFAQVPRCVCVWVGVCALHHLALLAQVPASLPPSLPPQASISLSPWLFISTPTCPGHFSRSCGLLSWTFALCPPCHQLPSHTPVRHVSYALSPAPPPTITLTSRPSRSMSMYVLYEKGGLDLMLQCTEEGGLELIDGCDEEGGLGTTVWCGVVCRVCA